MITIDEAKALRAAHNEHLRAIKSDIDRLIIEHTRGMKIDYGPVIQILESIKVSDNEAQHHILAATQRLRLLQNK